MTKRLLRLMEGKHHDKKPKYSRKGRNKNKLEKEKQQDGKS